jgi:PmbA protein
MDHAHAALANAIASGASQAEATITVSDRFSTEARDRAVTKLEQSTAHTLHMRVFVDGRKATLTTCDLHGETLRDAISAAVSQARHVAHDEFAVLPETRALDHPDLELYSDEVVDRDEDVKIDEALNLERLIRERDARVANSNGSHVGDTVSTTVLANSTGFAGAYRATRVHRSSSPVALDVQAKRTASYGTAARRISDMEAVEAVAKKAVQRTVGMFGARKPQTMRVPVIFERDVAAAVLSDVFAAVSAANVCVGNSWLADRVGDRIGNDLVTIVDDGTMPALLGSSPFDGEGVPTRRTVVFDHGIVRTFLYDTYYARKLGAQSTANSTGGGVGPNNFYLQPGSITLDELIQRTSRGVLVMDTIGFATEHASGTYSRGARGYYIENGEIAYPIEEFTIASTFPHLLERIDAVAGDLRFDGAVVSPSFRVAEMTISGD